MQDGKLWSVDEVGAFMGVSTSTVRRMLRNGKLRGRKVGAQWRFEPEAVKTALRSDGLTGTAGTRRAGVQSLPVYIPRWAAPLIAKWRRFVLEQLLVCEPDHVVVTDRRGSKVWEMLGIQDFAWGENLWHSAAVRLMKPDELRSIFARRRVLLFDEIIQYGREIAALRRDLESIESIVFSLACVRRRSVAERGALLDYGVLVCEDLDDSAFSGRAASVSRLTSVFRPPLDVDHLVIRGTLDQEVDPDVLLERMSRWGLPFIIWHPSSDELSGEPTGVEFHDGVESMTLAMTLDRPQFFDTAKSIPVQTFQTEWDGPCKVRFYVDPTTRVCYCSFIVYPTLEASTTEWIRVAKAGAKRDNSVLGNISADEDIPEDQLVKRVYASIAMELALDLLADFIRSGAASDLGIGFSGAAHNLDEGQFRATFGPGLGRRVLARIREVLDGAEQHTVAALTPSPSSPPARFVRGAPSWEPLSHSGFDCRRDLLPLVPKQHRSDGETVTMPRCITYSELAQNLANYSETTIGRVFDYEIDRGTIKPFVDVRGDVSTSTIRVVRGFVRGEFGVYYEWDGAEPTHEDALQQFAITLGPTVVDQFAQLTKVGGITATHFAKLFANLQHDWREIYGDLFLGWRPYKYGPLPIVPVSSASGNFIQYETFLIRNHTLVARQEKHGSQTWTRYSAPEDSPVPWRKSFRNMASAVVRTHISSLVRLYAAIQERCTTTRERNSRSATVSVLKDPLVVLGAARNERTAYRCGWFEVHDWVEKGRFLFGLIDAIAKESPEIVAPKGFLRRDLEAFAQPAALLREKVEMYRNLPHLRRQIEELVDEFIIAEVVLETVDEEPTFSDSSLFPVGNLEWASHVMRAFSSFTRQIATACGLDEDTRSLKSRTDESGRPVNSEYYLNALVENCPELLSFRSALEQCIADAATGTLKANSAAILSRTFRLIVELFEQTGRIPDPRPIYERRRAHGQEMDGLIVRFNEIPVAEPYVVAVADVRNLQHLPTIGEILGIGYDEAMHRMLNWLREGAKHIRSEFPNVYVSEICADNVILAGASAENVIQASILLIRETTRKLGAIDRDQLAQLGLLRIGVAVRDSGAGEAFQAVTPGLIAHSIGDQRGRPLGSISVTQAVFDRLGGDLRSEFEISPEPQTIQGLVWTRRWSDADREI